ncbi:MAG TPA: TylF/MycF/NovP-related O-methyltransferase [Polyangiaceae bacterium]
MTKEYLDLLENVLSFSLWKEPLKPLNYTAKRGLGMKALRQVDKVLRKGGLAIAIVPKHTAAEGKDWPVCAHTMIGQARLRNIRQLCDEVDWSGVRGAYVECGVWRGGASIYARACLSRERPVICCDTFAGMPQDNVEPQFSTYDVLAVSEQEVRENFSRFRLNDNVHFVKGPFSETLSCWSRPIAILRVDGDMYSSTTHVLTHLGQFVTPGGFIIIDDWNLPLCRMAVEVYRKLWNISSTIVEIDNNGIYWQVEDQ